MLDKFKAFISVPKGKIICTCVSALLIGLIVAIAFFATKPSVPAASTISSKNTSYSISAIIGVTSVSLDQTSMTLSVGDSAKLNAKVLPENAANLQLLWSSSDKSIVSVVDGNIVAQQVGESQVSATSCNGIRAVCKVVVKAKSAASSSSPETPSNGIKASSDTSANRKGTRSSDNTAISKPSNSTHSTTQPSGHVPVPTTQAEHYKTIGGNSLNLNTTGHVIQIQVDLTNAQKYLERSDDPLPLNVKIFENGSLYSESGYYGDIGDEKTTPVVFDVDSYYKYGYYWTKGATYKVEFYVNAHLFQTINFSVNENGFTN